MRRALLAGVALGLAAGCGGSGSPSTAGPAAPPPAGTAPAAGLPAPADWTAYHGDAAHSGYAATAAPAGPVATAWSARLDGVVQASPLVVGDRVVAATERNTVYALDRATGAVLWQRHLAEPVPAGALPCGNITPVAGITGTPVYDPATHRVFAVTTTPDGRSTRHTLVGLDVATGAVAASTAVDPPGSDPLVENQRGALGFSAATGRVLVPLGGHAGDCGDYHGYLVSVPATGGPGTVFRAGTGTEAGAWQPAGPAVDADGLAYVVTGNGSATSPPYDGSDAVDRVDPATGRSVSHFHPPGWAAENARDLDLGSSGVALVGDLLWVQGKTATGYLLRRTDLGGERPAATVTGACATQFGGPAVHGSAVFAPCTDGVRRIDVRPDATHALGWRAPRQVTGSPVVGGGRVWSLDPRAGVLYALDEATGAVTGRTGVGSTVRFATPALSGGLVLVPTTTGITAVTGG